MAKKLEVRHLTISFRTNNGAVRAVRDISFDLNEGETLAIAGESGSGKSVTTRAVMGILAGNAMVENGEIIYDGKDLLKIPEEDFHTLRGHKLAMVFQDPLSALNPIMRIGKQLTEAMILNNKERRADGKKRFNHMLEELEKNMTAAGVTDAKGKCEEFNRFTVAAVKLENAWKNAQEQAIGMLDSIEETETPCSSRTKRRPRKSCAPWSAPEESVQSLADPRGRQRLFRHDRRGGAPGRRLFHGAGAGAPPGAGALKEAPEPGEQTPKREAPNFFRIGYLLTHGGDADPQGKPWPPSTPRPARPWTTAS